jgi:hypothetical protein
MGTWGSMGGKKSILYPVRSQCRATGKNSIDICANMINNQHKKRTQGKEAGFLSLPIPSFEFWFESSIS